jgi:hypothetical protein
MAAWTCLLPVDEMAAGIARRTARITIFLINPCIVVLSFGLKVVIDEATSTETEKRLALPSSENWIQISASRRAR